MNKEIIEKKLNTEIELLKIFSAYLIALIAGISTIIISEAYTDKYVLYLLYIGTIAFFVVFVYCIYIFFRIKKLYKFL